MSRRATRSSSQALIRDKRIETLYLLAASQTRDKDALTDAGVERVIGELRESFDWVICDSPAGIERGALLAMRFADEAIVVTNPEVSSVRDSDRIIGLLDSRTRRAEIGERMEKQLLLTRSIAQRSNRGEMLSVEDVLEILSIPLLGIIPESHEILRASNLGAPITMNAAASPAGRAYHEAARRLAGEMCRSRCPTRRRPSSTAGSVGGRHEPVWLLEGKATAPVARERLQILLAHERLAIGPGDLVAVLRDELSPRSPAMSRSIRTK